MGYKAEQGIKTPSSYSEFIYWVRKEQEREQMLSERKPIENDIKWVHFTLNSGSSLQQNMLWSQTYLELVVCYLSHLLRTLELFVIVSSCCTLESKAVLVGLPGQARIGLDFVSTPSQHLHCLVIIAGTALCPTCRGKLPAGKDPQWFVFVPSAPSTAYSKNKVLKTPWPKGRISLFHPM